jgi:hypothetical protein
MRSPTDPWLVGVRSAAILLAICSLAYCLLSRGGPSEPVATTGEGEFVGSDVEEWVAQVSRVGSGVVRTKADLGTHENGSNSRVVSTAGALSMDGQRNLEMILEGRVSSAERRLKEAGAEGEDDLRRYEMELDVLLDIEVSKLELELFRRGAYLTTTGEDLRPPEPPGVSTTQMGPFALESGRWGYVWFFVDLQKRQVTREFVEALRTVRAAGKEAAMARFHSKTYEERRAWVLRYQELESKAGKGVAAMTADEAAEHLSMQHQLRMMDAVVDESSATLRVRQ